MLLVVTLSQRDFGLYSYVVSIVAIGLSVMRAGLSELAVKAFVHRGNQVASTMMELIIAREAFALIGYISIGVLSYFTSSNLALAATLLASLALFGRALDAPEFWFVARMDSRTPATIRIVASLVMLAIRIGLLIWYPSLWLFLTVFACEALVVGILIIYRYWSDIASPGFAPPSANSIVSSISESLPLLLSGIANQVNLGGDVVILNTLLGATSVGIYSAASRFSELAYFLPVVYMNAAFPHIIRLRRDRGAEHRDYLGMMQRGYDIAFWSGVAVAGVIGLVGTFIIGQWFGPEYAESRSVLLIHVAACPFIFMAAVYSKWVIVEGILWTSLLRHSLGAAVNIALCMYLIPIHGVKGAAIATICSYTFASYGSCFIGGTKNRQAGMAMTRAMVAPFRYAALFIHKDTRTTEGTTQ